MRWQTPTGLKTPETATVEIDQIIVNSITHQPRSLQKRIGPSEIGDECDHCLAAKLAGWTKHDPMVPWAATVGTGGHLLMETFFHRHNQEHTPRGGAKRFVMEETIPVGYIGNTEITGSTDLLDLETGMTVDWKFVGKSSLDKYRRQGPSQKYRVQAHLYAHGWNRAGIPVQYVSICFLPRATNTWTQHFWWHEEYQPQIAEQALERANRIHTQLTALANVSAQARDQWITSLPRAQDCWDCKKYPDWQPPVETIGGITIDL